MRHLPQDLTRQPDEDGPRWLLWTLDAFAGGILVLLCILAFFFMGLLSNKADGSRHERQFLHTTAPIDMPANH